MVPIEGKNTKSINVDGTDYLNFSGSSYLDLSGDEEMRQAAVAAVNAYGFANDLGYNTAGVPVLAVEAEAARFFGTEAALYFTSAYVASLAAVLHLARDADLVLLDAQAHHSLRHGARLTGLPVVEFAHRDPEDLARRLSRHLPPRGRPLALTDGVFPTWGDVAPLAGHHAALEGYGGVLFVDDAHGSGVLGARGRGAVEHHGLSSPRVHFAASLGKAFGTQGGILPGTAAFVEAVRAASPVYNAVSLPAMPVAAGAVVALRLGGEPDRRERLWRNARRLKRGVAELGFPVPDSVMPVATLTTGAAARNRDVHDALLREGFWVNLSNYVAAPEERALRNAVYASHLPEEIDALLDCYRRNL